MVRRAGAFQYEQRIGAHRSPPASRLSLFPFSGAFGGKRAEVFWRCAAWATTDA